MYTVFCLVALIVGHSASDPTMITLARLCYFPGVGWTAALGVGFRQGRELE